MNIYDGASEDEADNDHDLVSVVVPSYNHARHVRQALLSVADQDYRNLELIIVDDASMDDSVERINSLVAEEAFSERFGGRVDVIVNDRNLGAHATINQGLRRASGSFLTVLNSDDSYHPSRVSRLAAALRTTPAEFAFTGVAFMDENSEMLDERDPEVVRLRNHQESIGRFPSVGFACMCSNVTLSTGNMFFSMKLFDSIGNFEDLKYCHDWDFLLRAVLISEPVFVPEAFYCYRLHSTNSFRLLDHIAEEETMTVLARYFESVRRGEFVNSIAPSPKHWPGVFEKVMTENGFWRYWSEREPRET